MDADIQSEPPGCMAVFCDEDPGLDRRRGFDASSERHGRVGSFVRERFIVRPFIYDLYVVV